MIVRLGSGASECLVNTDKVLMVTRMDSTSAKVLSVNGAESEYGLTFDDLSDVPGFHLVEVFQGNTGRVVEALVNMDHLVDARATVNDGVSYLSLARAPGADGASLRLRVAMTIPQLAELLQAPASPAPRM